MCTYIFTYVCVRHVGVLVDDSCMRPIPLGAHACNAYCACTCWCDRAPRDESVSVGVTAFRSAWCARAQKGGGRHMKADDKTQPVGPYGAMARNCRLQSPRTCYQKALTTRTKRP